MSDHTHYGVSQAMPLGNDNWVNLYSDSAGHWVQRSVSSLVIVTLISRCNCQATCDPYPSPSPSLASQSWPEMSGWPCCPSSCSCWCCCIWCSPPSSTCSLLARRCLGQRSIASNAWTRKRSPTPSRLRTWVRNRWPSAAVGNPLRWVHNYSNWYACILQHVYPRMIIVLLTVLL